MREELTQAELDDIFYGKQPTVTARFYKTEILDKPASKAAGERVMKTVDYVELKCEKEGSEINRLARPLDKKKFAREYAAFVQESEQNGPAREVPDIRPKGQYSAIGDFGQPKAKANW